MASQMLGGDAAGSELRDGMVVLPSGRRLTLAEIALHSLYILDQHQIMGSSSHISTASPPPFSAHFCELEVDEETGKVTVLEYIAAVDCGSPGELASGLRGCPQAAAVTAGPPVNA